MKTAKVFVPTVYKPRTIRLDDAAKDNPFFLEKSEPMKHGCRVFKNDERISQWEERNGKHKAKKRMQLMRVKQILAMREARKARIKT